jgi:hypothetical protein
VLYPHFAVDEMCVFSNLIISRLGEKLRLMTCKHTTHCFKNFSIKMYDLSVERDLLNKVCHMNIFHKLMLKITDFRNSFYTQHLHTTPTLYICTINILLVLCTNDVFNIFQWSILCKG